MLFARFLNRLSTVKQVEDAFGVPVLGNIPWTEEEGPPLIKDHHSRSPIVELNRWLCTNLYYAVGNTPFQSLVITSPTVGEGKSTVTANLGTALIMLNGMANKRVLIIDADMRGATQNKFFKIDPRPGLTDVLVSTHTLEETVRPIGIEGLSLLPSGLSPPDTTALLGSPEMGILLAEAKTQYDFVLLDTPPALYVPDAAVLASRVDGVLIVAAYGMTGRNDAINLTRVLTRARANVLGVVLNRDRRIDPNALRYYSRKYWIDPRWRPDDHP
jgi:capsular exopolysaccharide synthesis family protein